MNTFALWNEPDHPGGHWLPRPNARAYSRLLRLSYPAIKSVNPRAKVLIGGLVNNKHDFLQAIYNHGGGRFFDAVGNHMYPQYAPTHCPLDGRGKPSRHALCGIRRLREVLRRNGDARKGIWLTELSFSSCKCHYVEPIGEWLQASYLQRTFRWLARQRRVPVALWFNLRNYRGVKGRRGDLGGEFGLLRADDSPKPAFFRFRRYAKRWASMVRRASSP